MRHGTAILTICLLRLSTAAALEADACAQRTADMDAKRSRLTAEEPQLKAEMATAFSRLESDVNAFADRDPALKKRVDDMKRASNDLSRWWDFAQLFGDAGLRLQEFGRGNTAWDTDIVGSLGMRIAGHETLAREIRDDEFHYQVNCVDSPPGVATAILDALKARGVKDPELLQYTDLTKKFRSTSAWAVAAVQEKALRDPEMDLSGPLFVCFLKNPSPACLDSAGQLLPISGDQKDMPYELFEIRVVQASTDGKNPRLFVRTCTWISWDGDCGIYTTLYSYNATKDRFDEVFRNDTAHNNNQLTRFIESGPLLSDIIVTYPTTNAPYTYWVEVHRARGGGKYTQILKYRGKTEYNDGNRLAVIDSEMPETLRRLGLWKTGDPLPLPPKLPNGCATLYMRGGIEWCK